MKKYVSSFNVMEEKVYVKDTESQEKITTLSGTVGELTTQVTNIDVRVDVNETDLQTIKNENALIKNRSYVFITDSYGDSFYSSSWIPKIANYLKIWANYHSSYLAGSGFTSNGVATFLQQLMAINIADKNSVTDIVVGGGYNEFFSGTIANIENAIVTFKNYCDATFPNAKVWIGMIGWTTDSANIGSLRKTSNEYKKCVKYGCFYMNGIEYALRNDKNFNDTIHPNDKGAELIAQSMYSCFKNGSCDVSSDFEQAALIASPGVTMTQTTNMYTKRENNVTTVMTPLLNVSFASPFSYVCSPVAQGIEICSISNTFIHGESGISTPLIEIPMVVQTGASTGFQCMGQLYVVNKKIYIKPIFVDVPNWGWYTANIVSIQLSFTNKTFDTTIC